MEIDIHSLGWPIKNLHMSVRDASGAFTFRDAPLRVLDEVKADAAVGYHITPIKSGTHELVFLAEGSNLGPLEGILTTINEPDTATWAWVFITGLYLVLGSALYLGPRQMIIRGGQTMPRINEWREFARQNQVRAIALTSVPFITLALLLNFYTGIVYDGGPPGVMVAVIIILYLVLTAVLGFVSRLRVGSIGPVLAYVAIRILWIVLPVGESHESLTYESGWVGVAVSILVASAVIWLAAFAGNLIGDATRSDK